MAQGLSVDALPKPLDNPLQMICMQERNAKVLGIFTEDQLTKFKNKGSEELNVRPYFLVRMKDPVFAEKLIPLNLGPEHASPEEVAAIEKF